MAHVDEPGCNCRDCRPEHRRYRIEVGERIHFPRCGRVAIFGHTPKDRFGVPALQRLTRDSVDPERGVGVEMVSP